MITRIRGARTSQIFSNTLICASSDVVYSSRITTSGGLSAAAAAARSPDPVPAHASDSAPAHASDSARRQQEPRAPAQQQRAPVQLAACDAAASDSAAYDSPGKSPCKPQPGYTMQEHNIETQMAAWLQHIFPPLVHTSARRRHHGKMVRRIGYT